MTKMKGKVTKVEEIEVEISAEDIAKEAALTLEPKVALNVAKSAWIRSVVGHCIDVRLSTRIDEKPHWEQYENYGSHYSGWYDTGPEVTEEQVNIYRKFEELEKLLKEE